MQIAGACSACSLVFCSKHRLPETHKCKNQDALRSAAFAANKAKLESERTSASRGLAH